MRKLCTTEEVVKALENRDSTALADIQKNYGALLRRIAVNLGLNPGDTEECMNDTYFEVWNTIPPAKPESIRSYVCMLMRRIAIDRIRYNSAEKRAHTVYLEVSKELESCIDVENTVIDEMCMPTILNQFLEIHATCNNQSEDAIRFMGQYIHDINLISNREANCLGTYRATTGYYVCVVDSALYPATAEHIRSAQNNGHPTRLTIDRSGASQRRTESLQNIPTRREFDRDEYPMALFSEGGLGADVAHLEGTDNRGAGAYVGWQLRGVPDGAEVRIRVI